MITITVILVFGGIAIYFAVRAYLIIRKEEKEDRLEMKRAAERWAKVHENKLPRK